MSKVITAVNTNLAFSTLYTVANTLVQVLANEIVTANSAAGGGATTTGNGFVIGIFGANTVVAPLLVGGNVVTTNVIYLGANLNVNSSIITGTSLTINSTSVLVGNVLTLTTSTEWGNTTVNTFINSISIAVSTSTNTEVINSSGFFYNGVQLNVPVNINVQTSGLGSQVIDSWALATYRAVEYVMTIKDNNANNYQAADILLLQSTGAAEVTEYAIIVSNTGLGAFSASVNTTSAILSFTPTSSNTQVKGTRTAQIPV